MKKRLISFLVTLIMILSSLNVYAIADSAECACVINCATGDVVLSKNIDKRHAMASTTKIMTAIVALENSSPDDIITVSANAANQEGSSAYIEENMQIYMQDMLYGLMLNSGNDAAVAIAEHISGDVTSFANLMNEKAVSLGLKDTHFVNPNGLDDPQHFTTAGDLAQIARYAMQNDTFRKIVSTQTMQIKPLNSNEILYFSNHNKMLNLYQGATGIKTGYTSSTGRCLVSSAMRDGMEFIAVTLNDSDDWNDHTQMLDYAFSEHYPKKVIEKNSVIKKASIDGTEYEMIAADDFVIPFKEHGKTNIEIISHIASNLQAPINAGEKVGYLEILCNGLSIGQIDILSKNDINNISGIRIKNSFYNSFIHIIKTVLV